MHRGFLPIALVVVMLSFLARAFADPLMGPAIIAASNPGDQFVPAVASADEYGVMLAVWEQDNSGVRAIVGRLIASDGTPLGDSFFISDAGTDQTDPDVVYDPQLNRYLVVWVGEFSPSDTDIWGRFVPWNGFDPGLLPFVIESPLTLQLAPALAYTPAPVNEYFLVWHDIDGFDPPTIRAKRLVPDTGSDLVPAFPVVGDTTYNRMNPRIAWNAEVSRYLVVYERFQGSDDEDVYAAELSFSGTVFTSDLGIAGFAAVENQVDVAACEDSWMVVWTGGEPPADRVYARPVAGDFTLGGITDVSDPFYKERHPRAACNPHGHEFFLMREVTFSGDVIGAVGAFLDPDGTLLDTFNVLTPAGSSMQGFRRPAVAVSASEARAYVVTQADRADLVHQDLVGRWVDMSLFSDSFESGNPDRWSSIVP